MICLHCAESYIASEAPGYCSGGCRHREHQAAAAESQIDWFGARLRQHIISTSWPDVDLHHPPQIVVKFAPFWVCGLLRFE